MEFYLWADNFAFKWQNRRSGKLKSIGWKVFLEAIVHLRIAIPKLPVTSMKPHRMFS